MLVKNLQPWAGLDFGYAPGDIVDLPDEVAQARIDAGLAELADAPKKKPAKAAE